MQHLRNCPLCGGRGMPLYNNTMASLNELDMSYEVHGCLDCGMTYAGKLPSEDEYQRYYSLFSKYDVGALSEDSIRMHQLLADIIAGHCAPGTRVLDIGCGDGHLLSCLKQRGMHELYGIDPAPHAPQAAMNRYGIDTISTGFLKDIVDRAKTGSYKLFCLSAVLEHLSAPADQLKELLERAQGGTCIAVEVPDLESFDAAHAEPLGEFSLEHINYFSRSSLRNLFATGGCVEVCCQRVKHSSGGSLLALYRKEGVPHFGVQVNDTELMREYATRSTERMQSLLHKVAGKLHAPFLIYGAGSHTARILPMLSADLRQLPVHAIIDNNPNLAGKQLGGIPIVSAAKLGDYPGRDILISSFRYETEIKNYLANEERERAVLTIYADE